MCLPSKRGLRDCSIHRTFGRAASVSCPLRPGKADSAPIRRGPPPASPSAQLRKAVAACDQAVAEQEEVRELLIELELARAALHVDLAQPEHRVPEVADLALLEAELLPGLPDRGEAPGALLAAAIDDPLHGGRAGRRPLDVVARKPAASSSSRWFQASTSPRTTSTFSSDIAPSIRHRRAPAAEAVLRLDRIAMPTPGRCGRSPLSSRSIGRSARRRRRRCSGGNRRRGRTLRAPAAGPTPKRGGNGGSGSHELDRQAQLWPATIDQPAAR